MNKEIEEKKNSLKNIQDVQEAKIYLGKFKNDFYRCKITNKKKDGFCEVLFIDFGNLELLKQDNLRVCPETLE